MRRLTLSQGQQALLDDDDYDLVADLNWYASEHSHTWYAARDVRSTDEQGRPKRTRIYLHRFIMKAPSSLEVIHRNGDGLDNRRANLMLGTRKEANAIRSANYKKKEGSSGYRGVYRAPSEKSSRPWYAAITVDGKTLHLGRFVTEVAAARAYDKAARENFGEAAQANLRPREQHS